MTGRYHSFPRLMTLLWVVGIAASVAGCGRTLVFAERDGVNLAIRANASSSPPIEVNFGLNRTIATIVPPAGENGGKPSGEAVNMFAGFQVEQPTSPDPKKPLDVDVKIDTQFASGAAAQKVAGNPTVVARIVNVGGTLATFSNSPSTVQLVAWLNPGGTVSQNRMDKLQAWLSQNYPTLNIPAPLILDDVAGANYEAVRIAALGDPVLMTVPK
jgi:hypothetical protein